MTAVFYSEIPALLIVNGIYFGEINKNVKIVEDFNKNCILEFVPQNKEYYPITTSLKNACSIKVFNLLNDIIIIPVYEKKRNLPYKLIYQNTFNLYRNSLLVTVIQDGFYKFYIDGILSYIDELPFLVSECEVKEIQNVLVVVFKGKKQIVFAFDLNTNKLVYKSLAESVDFEGCFTVTNAFNATIPVSVVERWEIPNFTLIGKSVNLLKNQYEISPKLSSICFFELIALNADTSFLLTENIKNREKELHGFIGKPIVIFPYFKDYKKTVVVLNDSVHLYTLEYLGGLINNILEE